MSERGMVENLKIAGLAFALGVGGVACGQNATSFEQVSATSRGTVSGTAPGTELDATTTTTEFQFDGTVTDGRDAAVRAEDDAGLYDCGGVKGETWKNEDGTDKPFNPDHIVDHMNAHPELAKSDESFWKDIFSEDGFNFLAEHGVGNQQHADGHDVNVDGVSAEYSSFIAKQNAAAIKVDAVSENFACKDAAGNYHVFPVGAKALKVGETHLTGVALTKADYDAFAKIVQDQGKDLGKVFIQEMHVDTDGNGEADTDFVVVFTKHEMCGNNELKLPVAPPTTETTTPPVNTTTPRITVTTVPGVTTTTNTTIPITTTTKVGPKEAHPPVTGGATTTVEAPVSQPTPEPTNAPTTAPPETQPTIVVTAPTTAPGGGINP